MCWEDRKSLPNNSAGRPPVPDGLAQRAIFRVPPYLGVAAVGVGDVVVVVTDVLAGVVVVCVAGVVLFPDSPQPIIDMVMMRRAISRMSNLFISFSLLLFYF